MQNQSKREELIIKLKKLRTERRNEVNEEKREILLQQILEIEDEIRIEEFDGDKNIGRFNCI
jgi:hypothetical protein